MGFRVEIPGYIGTVDNVNIPAHGSFPGGTNSFHVFLLVPPADASSGGFLMPSTIYALNSRYIGPIRSIHSLRGEFLYGRPMRSSESGEVYYVPNQASASFQPMMWSSPTVQSDIIHLSILNSLATEDIWTYTDDNIRFPLYTDVYADAVFNLNFIVLTPDTPVYNNLIETGILTAFTPWTVDAGDDPVDIYIPGLREMVVASSATTQLLHP